MSDLKWTHPEVKVTKIKDRWHVRLTLDGRVVDEMACELREDIGYCCQQVLRWYDKMSGCSELAMQTRDRMCRKPSYYRHAVGQIWWSAHLRSEQSGLRKRAFSPGSRRR